MTKIMFTLSVFALCLTACSPQTPDQALDVIEEDQQTADLEESVAEPDVEANKNQVIEPTNSTTRVSNNYRDNFLAATLQHPDVSKISSEWQGNGFTKVVGAAGAIPGQYPVYVVSPNTGYAELTRSLEDGSFETSIVALPSSWILVKYDPTTDENLLYSEILEDERPHGVNGAIGTTFKTDFEELDGEGIPFAVSGSAPVDFFINGLMTGDYRAGGTVQFTGTVNVFPKPSTMSNFIGRSISFNSTLAPIFNEEGLQRIDVNNFFSNILTPTGLPIEIWSGGSLEGAEFLSSELELDETGSFLTAQISAEVALDPGMPPGSYAVRLNTECCTGSNDEVLEGARIHINPFMTNGAQLFPMFTIGEPAQPKLVWTLLTDVLSADGTRGVVAIEDQANFQISNRISTQSEVFIIPRISIESGKEITYRLEPYLPMIAHGDRYIPNVPVIDFNLPSGELNVTVTHPDGEIEILGTSEFTSAYSRTPVINGGFAIHAGGGHLAEVFQLGTNSGLFEYEFPEYGKYTIEMNGQIEDIYGNSYDGGGTYTIYVAESLDIEPAILPMTPLEVGNYINPGVMVLPGVPADIETVVTLFPQSDPNNKLEYVVEGQANNFGFFTPEISQSPFLLSEEGEFVVETKASYWDTQGVLWMGSYRWGQVGADPETSLIVHGRRGRDNMDLGEVKLWFTSSITQENQGTHMFFPYMSGDIIWQPDFPRGDGDAMIVSLTAEDGEGDLEQNALQVGLNDAPKRISIGETPLSTSMISGVSPTFFPEDIDTYAYWYGGVERPGLRVREIIGTEDTGTAYWRFDDSYGMQPGSGISGDLENDFKFLFGGAVFRDIGSGLNKYGIYASTWFMSSGLDVLGARVFPPFQGANGGPSGGPLLRLGREAIDAFVMPLSIVPGTILEVGNTFSFSAHVVPTLPGYVEVAVTSEDGFSQSISGRANKIGYFYDPSQDFLINEPGLYHVSVTVTFDEPTSAGPMSEPYPKGTILGQIENGYYFYVVESNSSFIPANFDSWGSEPFTKAQFTLGLPDGIEIERGWYSIAMPGFLLETGDISGRADWFEIVYDAFKLASTFRNIDLRSRTGYESGLSDTVWINVLVRDVNGEYFARTVTLQGDVLYSATKGD